MADGTDEEPLVGVVIFHQAPRLLVTMDPDDSLPWVKIGWIAQDNG